MTRLFDTRFAGFMRLERVIHIDFGSLLGELFFSPRASVSVIGEAHYLIGVHHDMF
jgi:hypothetical protein